VTFKIIKSLQDIATYSLKLSIKNCSQTTTVGDKVTTDSL